ncbi:beta-phosphoglucomutase [Anaeromicrobium sediminis]|uniref:Beta-phosphoglucomutase n=1 Tax=Anaeromicrobium sediminis TaxID=1478221 RepID=A0A267ML21_9FIRM|nr:beta-phosphoglucomutase [Anaeromicrobium sediminis]PAB60289.1 beta-phosphoglucomutase [Anaeromicrobium sediminis]
MKNIEAIIFDLDGVIVDTAKYHFLAWQRLARELDIEFTIEDNERLKGVSRMRSLEIILEIGNKTLDEKEKEDLAFKKNEWYKEYIANMDESEILEGAKEFIELLRENNIKVVLGSASKNAKTILEKLNLIDCFHAIIDGTCVTKAKPDPQVFLQGAEAVGIDPINCIVFEDAEAGIEAAKRAGMVAIGVGEADTLKDAHIQIKGLYEMNMERLMSL